jgi:ACS family tartrate transporter-like MFS transporter
MAASPADLSPLDRARRKAYWRLIPLLFLCYVVAYIDRVNVGFAKLTMQPALAHLGFTEALFGFAMGIFFAGYLLLEIPGTLLVEKWSARKWISRILLTWGLIAAMTAFVHYNIPIITPFLDWAGQALGILGPPGPPAGVAALGEAGEAANEPLTVYALQFCSVRFLLGLAEAGFFPGVIVYLTHWFPSRDRTRALAAFLIGTPIAQMIGPPLSNPLIRIGEDGRPPLLGLVGWQWVYIAWGIPAIILGFVVLAYLTDRPKDARWLTDEERDALETELARERAARKEAHGHMGWLQGLANPKILILAAAYFFVVTGNYGVELYMASILKDWYNLEVKNVAYLIVIPPIGSLIGQLFIGWSSDRTGERRYHAALPILLGAAALVFAPWSKGSLWLTVTLFTIAMLGLKAYLPAFWALPSVMLTEAAAAASIGLINSFGNLGGWFGPSVLGYVRQSTGSYAAGLWFLAASMSVAACIILGLGIGKRAAPKPAKSTDPLADPLPAT